MRQTVLTILICLSAMLFAAYAKGDAVPNYDIETTNKTAQGAYIVKVTVVTKDKKIPEVDFKRAAVHGVLFRGATSTNGGPAIRPIAGSAANEGQHGDFYKDFFAPEGQAAKFASLMDGSRSITKSGKEYRHSVIAIVQKDQLRKFLEDAGVIKGLNSIF